MITLYLNDCKWNSWFSVRVFKKGEDSWKKWSRQSEKEDGVLEIGRGETSKQSGWFSKEVHISSETWACDEPASSEAVTQV